MIRYKRTSTPGHLLPVVLVPSLLINHSIPWVPGCFGLIHSEIVTEHFLDMNPVPIPRDTGEQTDFSCEFITELISVLRGWWGDRL